MALFHDYPDEPVPGKMVQGKITEADTPTIWLGASLSGLISDPSQSSPHFYAGCPSCLLTLCDNKLSVAEKLTILMLTGMSSQLFK